MNTLVYLLDTTVDLMDTPVYLLDIRSSLPIGHIG